MTEGPFRHANRWHLGVVALAAAVAILLCAPAFSQSNDAAMLAELMALKDKVGHPDTRTRVEAFHRVWTIGLLGSAEMKLLALELLKEPVGSSSDHIRMPAVYAIAEIANSTNDAQVKLKALEALREPMIASQVPIRNAAIDAVNSMVRSGSPDEVVSAALALLGEPARSGNNGVRIPAIHAIMRAAESSKSDRVHNEALELLKAPLDSSAMIGGMEVRMMAVVAVERIGLDAAEMATKTKAMVLMQSYANKGGWEPEAKRRAQEAFLRIQHSIQERKEGKPAEKKAVT